MFNFKKFSQINPEMDVPVPDESIPSDSVTMTEEDIDQVQEDMKNETSLIISPIFINKGRGNIPWAGFELPEELSQYSDEIIALGAFRPFKSRNGTSTQFTKRLDNSRDIGDFRKSLSDVKMIIPNISFDETALETVAADYGLKILEDLSKEEKEEDAKKNQMIHEWKKKLIDDVFSIKDTNKTLENNERNGKVIDELDEELDKLGAMADEAGGQAIIRNFLDFSAQMHKYSFNNQMLIFLQTGGADGPFETEGNWERMGRIRKPGENKAGIFVNVGGGSSRKPIDPNLTGDELEEEMKKRNYMSSRPPKFKFIPCILAYGQTIPDPDVVAKGGKVYEDPGKDVWMEENLSDSKAEALVHAILYFAKSKNIKVDLGEDTGSAGGYSSGGRIAIQGESVGIRQLSTLVHEMAHELLHWGSDRKEYSRKEKEIDAEATSWRVLKYFGYEPTSHAAYIALWKGGADDVKQRGKFIITASNQIIEGIRDYLNKYNEGTVEATLNRIHFVKEATFNLSKNRIKVA